MIRGAPRNGEKSIPPLSLEALVALSGIIDDEYYSLSEGALVSQLALSAIRKEVFIAQKYAARGRAGQRVQAEFERVVCLRNGGDLPQSLNAESDIFARQYLKEIGVLDPSEYPDFGGDLLAS
jgi:hypothetical protein